MAGFNLSINRITLAYTVSKPRNAIFGFICLGLCIQPVFSGSEHLLTHYLDILWRRNVEVFPLMSDSARTSFVTSSFIYNDIYHEKQQKEEKEVKKIIGESYRGNTNWLHTRQQYGIYTTFSAEGYYGIWKDVATDGFVSVKQDLKHIGIAAWAKNQFISGGLFLGKSLGDIIRIDNNNDLFPQNMVSGITTDISSNYKIFLKALYKNFSITFLSSRFLNQASLPTYELFSNGNFKTFPLAMATKSHSIDARANWPKASLGARITRKGFRSDTIVKSNNALPFTCELASRELAFFGSFGSNIPLVTWQLEMDYTGGYIEGYRGTFVYLTQDGIVLKSVAGSMECNFPRQLSLGAFGEYIHGETETYGYLKDAPFSSWSVLNPGGYRFQNMKLVYYEGGIFCTKKFTMGNRSQFSVDASFSRTRGKFSFIREDKKIIVWIPAYVNDTLITPFHFEGWNITGKIDYSVTFGKILINASIRQRIPLWKDIYGEWGGSTEMSDKNIDRSRHGGTEYTVGIRYGFCP